MTGTEVRTLTIKSRGLQLTVTDEPATFTTVALFDSENLRAAPMQLDVGEVKMLIGFLKGTLDSVE